jgi:ribulose-5-phosphate 4-epimerase/fuculose-1-phosphate aldolase
MSAESKLREEICLLGKSIFDRGLTHGSTGNVSAKTHDGWLLTPTGSNLGRLDPARLAKLDWTGTPISGDPPSKESFLHLAMYQERPSNGAVVHLHATHSVAVSVLESVDPRDVLPPMTAYYVMRIGRLPLVPYYPPGDMQLAEAVRGLASKHHALLLANHGPVVGGTSLAAAADAIEELEATAKLYLLVRGQRIRSLTEAEVAEIRDRYPIT